MIELENSENIVERQKYARQLKEFIKKWEDELPKIEIAHKEFPELLFFDPIKVKEAIKNLKIKLSTYDVYKQKTKCSFCQEIECVCYVVSRSNEAMSEKLQQRDETKSDVRSETVEEVFRATGGSDDNPSREELLKELPF